jgi:hypothetical protein
MEAAGLLVTAMATYETDITETSILCAFIQSASPSRMAAAGTRDISLLRRHTPAR